MQTIIVPTYNHCEDLLKPCLESIKKHTDLSNVEVLVVANGCKDGTLEYVKSLGEPFKLLWSDEGMGFTKAFNWGFKEAKGDVIIGLNNDTVLVANTWLPMLIEPFKDPQVGITGSLVSTNSPNKRRFALFLCVAIRREVVDKIGYLDEIFNPGGCEDMDYCIRAENEGFQIKQVPDEINTLDPVSRMWINKFPIWHKSGQTMHDSNCLKGYSGYFERNWKIVEEKYSIEKQRQKLMNNYERAVVFKTDDMNKMPREKTRYEWAKKNIVGNKILELGCSNGYGLNIIGEHFDYTGVDYSQEIVEQAKKEHPNNKFKVMNLELEPILEDYDTIIAFEVLEHLTNGKELAQELKKRCKCLLISAPYEEPKGYWGGYHKLHNLTEKDFPGFEYNFITHSGNLQARPDREYKVLVEGVVKSENLLLMKHCTLDTVTAIISTKNRYFTTLPLAVLSIINQTHKVDKLIIYDDGEHKDIREEPLWKNILSTLDKKGISWEVVFGEGKGQVLNHQKSLVHSNTKFIWRLDDDNFAESDVLEKLLSAFDNETGAVGGLVLDPKMNPRCSLASNKIENIYLGVNEQWYKPTKNIPFEVDHLYSTFLYRKEASNHGYCQDLSEVGHREETIFTYEMKIAGWKLKVTPDAITWHYRNSEGGIRSCTDKSKWAWDDSVLAWKIKNEWKIKIREPKIITLNNGLGDHLIFKSILNEVKAKYSDLILAVCYPEVFKDDKDIQLISIADATQIGDVDKDNIYRYMIEQNWKEGGVDKAFKQMLDIKPIDNSLKIYISELTNACNLKCSYCPQGKEVNYPIGFLSKENFIKSLNYSQEVAGLSMCGEPLLHPNICEFVEIAVKYGKKPAINTNGLLLTEIMGRNLIKSGMNSIEVSIHTEQSLMNYKTFFDINEEQETPIRLLGNVLTCNEDKIKGWIENCKLEQKHIDALRITPTHNWALDKETENNYMKRCWFINNNMCLMRWDGRIVSCCYDFEGVNTIGDIKDFSSLKHRNDYQLCKKCSSSWVNGGENRTSQLEKGKHY